VEITKLIPPQIMTYWPQIKECINNSLPPHVKDSDESMLRIQESLLVGNLECWLIHESGDVSKVLALATTCFVTDEVSMTKNLLVYTMATLNPHSRDLWSIAHEMIGRYAVSRVCSNVIAYSNLPEVINIAERLGGDTSWRIIYFPLS
jgi:hypothetical protein